MRSEFYLVEERGEEKILTRDEIDILEENMVEVNILEEVDPREAKIRRRLTKQILCEQF